MSDEYQQQVMDWRAEREASVRAENGWLALAGLFWLKQGDNSIGSDSSSDILLPARAPDRIGMLSRDGMQVVFHPDPGVLVEVNQQPVEGEMVLNPDTHAQPGYVTFDTLRMVVIERPNGIGLRLWDNLRPERRVFPPREWFPIDEHFRVPARYSRYPAPKPVSLPDVDGELQAGAMDGQVIFELDGRMHDLDVTELDDGRLYLQFRDLTSGAETYPAGRYYYTLDAVADGKISLDFNFSYSPPCAFTDFATCLFAPEQNFIKVRIQAGEYYRARH